MTTYEDLSPLTYFGDQHGSYLRAVGWLGSELEFARGAVSREFYDRLRELMASAFQPIATMGPHACELCQFDGPHGSRNLFVPDETQLLVCPELIVHYIAAHRYQPPELFQEAVMRCPDADGRDYKVAFLRAGGRGLMS